MAWTQTHKNQYQRDWGKSHPAQRLGARLRNKYDIVLSEYERMETEQENRCKICHRPFESFQNNRSASPSVDHSHLCPNRANHKNKSELGGCAECIRGVVCQQCNQVVVRFLELFPDRQTSAEREYMADRPILQYRIEARE